MKDCGVRFAVAAALSLLTLAAGCSDPKDSSFIDPGRIRRGMGLDFGGGSGGTGESAWADPAAILLGEIKHSAMGHPNRITAGPSGQLAVSDPRAGQVFVFDPFGELKFAIPVNRPLGVAFDDRGYIYVADTDTGSVQLFDDEGAFLLTLGVGAGEFVNPTDMAWSVEYQQLHVVDGAENAIKVYGVTGALEYSYGSPGAGNGQFSFPTGIALDDASDRVYVGDHGHSRVQVFTRAGAWQSAFGTYGNGQGKFVRVQGMALDRSGRLYVVDTFQGRMQVFDDAGQHISFLGEFGPGAHQLSLPMDVAFDSFGRLTVTSYKTGKLVVYGIDDFTVPDPTPPEPEPLLATVWLDPDIVPESGGSKIFAFVEVPDSTAGALVPETIRLQGTIEPDLTKAPKLGDVDGDGISDLKLEFLRQPLLDALGGPGVHLVSLTGELTTGEKVQGVATLTVTAIIAGNPGLGLPPGIAGLAITDPATKANRE